MFGLAALALFGAVTLATLVVFGVAQRGLHRYEQHYLRDGARRLGEMFIFVDSRLLMLLAVSVALLLGLIGWLLLNWFVGLLLFVVGFLSPRIVINGMRERRIYRFERQLVDVLTQMASAFRAGLTFVQAAENVAAAAAAPLGDEFKLLVREIKLGVAQDEALQHLAERVDSASLQLTVTSTNVSRQLGGNLAEMYELISKTVRDRFEVEGRVRALTAMGRMQAWVVGAMPLVVGLVFNFMRPDLMEPMLASNFGKALIGAVIVMELIGVWLIRRVVNIET